MTVEDGFRFGLGLVLFIGGSAVVGVMLFSVIMGCAIAVRDYLLLRGKIKP